MSTTMPETTRRALDEIGVMPDPVQTRALGQFLDLLIETNKSFNLTAIREVDQAWSRHVYDSLTLLPILEGLMPETLIDVGTGGGLPGIPLAIMMPETRITLLEATGKKVRFLERVASELRLANVDIVQERAETFGQRGQPGRDAYDVAIARAVGPLRVLLELTVPMVRVGGIVLAIKGERADEELDAATSALQVLRAGHLDTIDTPTGRIVVIEKAAPTPRAYPRRSGEPKHNPL